MTGLSESVRAGVGGEGKFVEPLAAAGDLRLALLDWETRALETIDL